MSSYRNNPMHALVAPSGEWLRGWKPESGAVCLAAYRAKPVVPVL